MHTHAVCKMASFEQQPFHVPQSHMLVENCIVCVEKIQVIYKEPATAERGDVISHNSQL